YASCSGVSSALNAATAAGSHKSMVGKFGGANAGVGPPPSTGISGNVGSLNGVSGGRLNGGGTYGSLSGDTRSGGASIGMQSAVVSVPQSPGVTGSKLQL